MTKFGGTRGRGEPAPVLVGVDGSPSAQEALAWAAAEASATRRPLHIVHCVQRPVMELPWEPASDVSRPRRVMELPPRAVGQVSADGGIHVAERVLDEADIFARLMAPDITVTSELIVTAAAPALLHKAEDAALVVVGSRGLGGFAGLLVGSVGVAVAGHAPCPVVVVHARARDRGAVRRIVVGVDGTDLSVPAVDFAFASAQRHGAAVTAVLAWTSPVSAHPAGMDVGHEAEREHRLRLEEALADARRRFADVDVTCEAVRARPRSALISESYGADLVVVGSRGRGSVRGLFLGSVSQAVLHHAQCPVAVVRPHR